MATLPTNELQLGRHQMARDFVPVEWTKAQINDALQAIEDLWEAPSTKQAFGNAIENAAPGVFSNAQKKKLGGFWMVRKALREVL